MRIARLEINGFRGIRTADLRFGPLAVMVGPNNVGKTTVVEALAPVLGRDGMVRGLTEHDFFGSDPQPIDRIKIVATIVDFPHPEPERNLDWFRSGRAVPTWFNASSGEVRYSPTPGSTLSCRIGFQARFDHATLETETRRFFVDDESTVDVFLDDAVTYVPNHLLKEIGLFLIPASRTWDRMISFGSELFRRVVSSEGGLPAPSVLAERDRLRSPEHPLEEDSRLQPIIAEVNDEIRALFGPGNDVRLRLTATDASSVLDAVVPHFGANPGFPSRRQGSGLISLQSLFLLLHFGTRRVEAGKGFCLVLEEPELHLPPTLQRRVLRRLHALSSQALISTHSPLIAGFTEPTDLLILRKQGGVLTASPMLDGLLPTTTRNSIRTLFEFKRVETVAALMAETVLVPEGSIDFEWLALFRRIVEMQSTPAPEGSFFTSAVGVIPTQDAAVVDTVAQFANVHPRIVALVDGDEDGRRYASDLAAAGRPVTLRWPNTWAIEDIVGWCVQPAESAVLSRLSSDLANSPYSVSDLVARLKNNEKTDPNRLKGDRLAYEAVARAIASSPASAARAAQVLDAVALAAKGDVTPLFHADTESPGVLIFSP